MRNIFLLLAFAICSQVAFAQSGLCDPITPFFQADLTGNPAGTWVSTPPVPRAGNCCGTTPPDNCIEFEITLDSNAVAINFDIATGAVPGGSMFYQINCGPPIAVGDPICLDGPGPHILTFCKPGNNINTYMIQSIPAPITSNDVTVGNGCSVPIGTIGVSLIDITWTSVSPGAVGDYDAFLSCTANCDTTIVTPSGTYPPVIGYQICGTPVAGPCYPDPIFCDTIYVNTIPPVMDSVPDAFYCQDSAGVQVDVFPNGGAPPFNYVWYDGPNGTGNIVQTGGSSYFATAPGTYSIETQDSLYPGCPSSFTDFNVSIVSPPIVDAGQDVTVCPDNPSVPLNGTVTNATGGLWVGGGGTFSPDDTTLNATYTPSAGEIAAGTTTLYLQSTGNQYCVTIVDSIVVTITAPVNGTITGDTLVCFGDEGTITVNPTGGIGPYSYLWNTGESTQSITVGPGTYDVSITDNSLQPCSEIISVTVTENPQLTVTVPDTNLVSCDTNATITISPSGGGGGPFTYLWSTGATTPSINVQPGQYIITAFDINNCPVSDTSTVTSSASSLNVTINQPDTVCNGGVAVITATVTGNLGPVTYSWSTGNTSSSITVGAGTYCVTVTDSVQCTSQSCVTIIENPPLVATIAGPTLVCFDSSSTVTAIVSGGDPGYSYSWSTGGTNQTEVLAPGSYTLTVTDDNSCTTNSNITISEATLLTVAVDSVDISCFGFDDGQAISTPSGGSGPYSYQWDNGGTTSSIGSLAPGSYTVEVTDTLGCYASDTVNIDEPLALAAVGAGTTLPSCVGASDGIVYGSVLGGTGPFSYDWVGTGQTADSLLNVPAGTYTLIVTDANGCVSQVDLTLNDPTPVQALIADSIMVSCDEGFDGGAIATAIGGTPGYSYFWPANSVADSANLNAFAAGSYIVVVTDGNGCIDSTSVTITEPPLLIASVAGTDVSCFGYDDGVAISSATGGTLPYFHSWSPWQSVNDTITNLPPGTYMAYVYDANGCADSIPVTINEPAQMLLDLASTPTACDLALGTAEITQITGGVSPFSHQWNDTANQTGLIANNLPEGYVSVTSTDADGCFAVDSIFINNIPAGAALLAVQSTVSCAGGADASITVSMSGTGTPPYSYEWYEVSAGAIGQTSQTATGLPIGSYYTEVTDSNGCVVFSDTVTITEPTPISLTSSSNNVSCFGFCDGDATITGSGGVTPYSYLWNDPLGQTNSIASNLCSGSFTGILTDANGCQDSAQFIISEPPAMLVDSIVANANCGQSDGSACANVTGGTAPYSYLWNTGLTSSCIIGIPGGGYSVQVTDANGCSETVLVDVQDLTGPTAFIDTSINVLCFGDCNGSATVALQGGYSGIQSVQWDASTGGQTSPTASNLCAGGYTVVVTDSLGCVSSTSITITQPNQLQINPTTVNPSCNGFCDGTGSVVVAGGVTPYTIGWEDGQGNVIGSGNQISNLCAGFYSVMVTDANGCNTFQTFQLIDPAPVSVVTSVQNVQCNGACNGNVTALPLSGVSPFTFQWDASAGNQSTQTAYSLCSGSYNVVVTDNNGCSDTVSGTVTEPQPLVISVTDTGHVSCFGAADGYISTAVSGGVTPYTFQWNSGSTSSSPSGLSGGNHCLTVTDANGCQSVVCVFINEPSPLLLSVQGVDVSCNGYCDGEVFAAASGGTGPYTYTWDLPGFPTGSYITNVCPGVHTVTVVDQNGCSQTTSVGITEPTAINMTASLTNANCGQNNGQICVNVSGGVLPYSYQWNDPSFQTTSCANNITSGCYSLFVTDGNYCIQDTVLCISDISGPSITTNSTTDVACFGQANGELDYTVTGGVSPYTLQLYNSAGQFVAGGLNNYTGLSADCYTFVVTDGAGCTAQVNTCINQPSDMITASSNIVNASCGGACDGQAQINAFGGTPPYIYSWSGGGSPSSNLNTGLCAGNYQVIVQDDNGCTETDAVTITEPTPISVSVSSTNVTCNSACDGGIYLTTSGGTSPYQYSWSNSLNTTSWDNGLCAGNFTIDVTDANGCTEQVQQLITEPQALQLTAALTNPSCGLCNGQAVLTIGGGTAPHTVTWYGQGNTPNSATNSGLCPGQSNVHVVDQNGCSLDTVFTFTNQVGPTVDSISTVDPTCFGSSTGSAQVFASSPIGLNINSYQWTPNAGSQTTPSATGLADGYYCVTVADVNGCQATGCAMLNEPPELIGVPDGSDSLCYGESVLIWASGSGGTPAYTINWDASTGFGTQPGPHSISPLTNTSYCFTVGDANGCVSAQSCIDIFVTDELLMNGITGGQICDGDSLVIGSTATGGNVPYTFDWTDGNGNTVASTDINDSTFINVAPSSDTWYYLSISDGCSQPAVDSAFVEVFPIPVYTVDALDTLGCPPLEAQFITNHMNGDTFQYDYDCDGVYDYVGTNPNPIFTYTQAGVYNVCVNVISASGCEVADTSAATITVSPPPVADFSQSQNIVTTTAPSVSFFDNSSTDVVNWEWIFGDGYSTSGNGAIPIGENNGLTEGTYTAVNHEFPVTAGTYDVMLVVTANNGCTDTAYNQVIVEGEFIVYVPNAMTPDGDGINDFFIPSLINADRADYELLIFDRWGELLFETHVIEKAWDGTYLGEVVKEDVYVWKLRVRDLTGKRHNFIGHVSVLK